jgi:hypothetical protein
LASRPRATDSMILDAQQADTTALLDWRIDHVGLRAQRSHGLARFSSETEVDEGCSGVSSLRFPRSDGSRQVVAAHANMAIPRAQELPGAIAKWRGLSRLLVDLSALLALQTPWARSKTVVRRLVMDSRRTLVVASRVAPRPLARQLRTANELVMAPCPSPAVCATPPRRHKLRALAALQELLECSVARRTPSA